MLGIRPLTDLRFSVMVLRPSMGRWTILEAGRNWDDFDNCRATAIRSVRVGRRRHRCWVTAHKYEVDPFASFVAYGLFGSNEKETYLSFNFYAVDPRIKPNTRATITLGSDWTRPRRLWKVYGEAMLKLL